MTQPASTDADPADSPIPADVGRAQARRRLIEDLAWLIVRSLRANQLPERPANDAVPPRAEGTG